MTNKGMDDGNISFRIVLRKCCIDAGLPIFEHICGHI